MSAEHSTPLRPFADATARRQRSQPMTARAVSIGRSELAPIGLLALAATGWWWTLRTARSSNEAMSGMTSAGPFLLAWVMMMAAMMFPAVWPTVRFYAKAAAAGRVAAVPGFVAGYLVVWAAAGLPGYAGWRFLPMPITEGPHWIGRVSGAVLIAAGMWQFTQLKSACLRHCRSPLSIFFEFGGAPRRSSGALLLGARHGLYCLGCCWALMAVMVAVGTMHLGWMAGLSVLIFIEKVVPGGELLGRVAGVLFLALGAPLLVRPHLLVALT